MTCDRCGNNSSLYFAMLDQLDIAKHMHPCVTKKWCPACVTKLLEANMRYLHGEFQGDQDRMIMK